ncbi:MAG TPA: hypothetical protein VMU94_14145 [Streptosporangiaceae bacterium]|nr:hypothetical protein [Streptosporangiaceae bacterium]
MVRALCAALAAAALGSTAVPDKPLAFALLSAGSMMTGLSAVELKKNSLYVSEP